MNARYGSRWSGRALGRRFGPPAIALITLLLASAPASAQSFRDTLSNGPLGPPADGTLFLNGDDVPNGPAFLPITNDGSALLGPNDGYYGLISPSSEPGPQASSGHPGLPGGNLAVRFSGNDSRIQIEDQSAFDMSGGFWISILLKPFSQIGTIFMQGDPTSDERSVAVGFDADGNLAFEVSRTGSDDLSDARLVSDPPPVDQWALLQVAYEPNAKMAIYQNGAIAAERTAGVPSNPFPTSNAPILIGNGYAGNRDPLDGSLDEIAFDAGATFSEEQAAELQNGLFEGGGREFSDIFHFPIGFADIVNGPGGTLQVENVGFGGSDGVGLEAFGEGLEQTGFFASLDASAISQVPGSLVGVSNVIDVGGVPNFFGAVGIGSTGTPSDVIVADFNPGTPIVQVDVFDGNTSVGSFTAPAGTVAEIDAGSPVRGIGSLPTDTGETGFSLVFDEALGIRPPGGGSLTGDNLKITAPGVDFSQGELLNINLIGIGADFTIEDEIRAPKPPPILPGDYNEDGIVSGADYIVWRDRLGQDAEPGDVVDADGSGTVDQADYLIWMNNFGMTS